MTIYQKLCLIREEHFHELHRDKEREFIEDMCDGLQGLPADICDEDMDEYITERQRQWINDIAVSVGIPKDGDEEGAQ